MIWNNYQRSISSKNAVVPRDRQISEKRITHNKLDSTVLIVSERMFMRVAQPESEHLCCV